MAAMGLKAQEIRPMPADSAYGVVHISVCNMREEGKFTSGMSTQALLGMPVKVLQYTGWYEIQTPDDYTGWVHRMVITPMSKEQYNEWNRAEKIVVTSHHGFTYEKPDGKSQTVSDVVAGNRLKWEGNKGHFYKVSYPDGRQAYIPKSISQPESKWRASLKQDVESIIGTAYTMMGFPYLWAGTSSKGVDCSGLVRTVLLCTILSFREMHRNKHMWGAYRDSARFLQCAARRFGVFRSESNCRAKGGNFSCGHLSRRQAVYSCFG